MTKVLVVLLGFNIGLASAQTRVRANDPLPTSGIVSIDLDFATVPTTVEQLIKQSNLIVDGRVISVLPPIRVNPRDPASIRTDSLVAVTRVLSGTMPTGAGTIAVSQFGGKIGDLEAVFPKDQMMIAGERYVFFLHPDKGPAPNVMGYLRYYPAGG